MTTRERFDAKWKENAETGCWEWTGASIGKGYGQFQVRPHKCKNAHRWAWRLYKGDLPDAENVLHKCDNPKCVNHEHLFLGSKRVNALDMKSKGRHLFGERNSQSKLTEEQVLEIHELRRKGMSTRALAERFKISTATIPKILRGDKWEHVYTKLYGAPPSPRYQKVDRRRSLSKDDVMSLHVDSANGMTKAALGRKYGVTAPHVRHILEGRKWRDVWERLQSLKGPTP